MASATRTKETRLWRFSEKPTGETLSSECGHDMKDYPWRPVSVITAPPMPKPDLQSDKTASLGQECTQGLAGHNACGATPEDTVMQKAVGRVLLGTLRVGQRLRIQLCEELKGGRRGIVGHITCGAMPNEYSYRMNKNDNQSYRERRLGVVIHTKP
ncbi:hypothetical protein Scep_025724 [Stephania cephalantha]|uniref:Uncharacterized protein n=1 Tax=Stephania cephalantha TaxID=152367 RepID=A0AAP0EIQ7_9MAGN